MYSALDEVLVTAGSTAIAKESSVLLSSSSSALTLLDEYLQTQPFLFAVTLYGRCLALVGTGDVRGGTTALALLKKAAAVIPASSGHMGDNNYDYRREIGSLLVQVMSASLFIAKDQTAEAIAVLRDGLQLQSAFGYREPASFYLPLRQCLAAALVHHAKILGAGAGAGAGAGGKGSTVPVSVFLDDAQQLYRDDLREHPHNVWSLRGQQTLAALSLSLSSSEKGGSSLEAAGEPALRGTSSCCEIGLC